MATDHERPGDPRPPSFAFFCFCLGFFFFFFFFFFCFFFFFFFFFLINFFFLCSDEHRRGRVRLQLVLGSVARIESL